jgi:hypothetical protein
MSTMKKKPTRIDSGIWLICTSMILLMRGELGRGLARAVKASLRIANIDEVPSLPRAECNRAARPSLRPLGGPGC